MGRLFLAKTIDNGDGTRSYGTPSFTVAGNSNFYYQATGNWDGFWSLAVEETHLA